MGLCALCVIVVHIKDREGCGEVLAGLILALLYPLWVPACSFCTSGISLLGREDKKEDDDLTVLKGLKMFENLGQYFLFIIL